MGVFGKIVLAIVAMGVLGLIVWHWQSGPNGLSIAAGPNFKISVSDHTSPYYDGPIMKIVSLEDQPINIKQIVLNKNEAACLIEHDYDLGMLKWKDSAIPILNLGGTFQFAPPSDCGTVVHAKLVTDRGVTEYDLQ